MRSKEKKIFGKNVRKKKKGGKRRRRANVDSDTRRVGLSPGGSPVVEMVRKDAREVPGANYGNEPPRSRPVPTRIYTRSSRGSLSRISTR